jgi:hypothetical protein
VCECERREKRQFETKLHWILYLPSQLKKKINLYTHATAAVVVGDDDDVKVLNCFFDAIFIIK